MRWLSFALSLLLTLALIYLGGSNQPLGSRLPPVGKLLSPFTGFWQNAEPAGAPADLTLDFPELGTPVEVVFDERRVPHIFAQNTADAFFVQGYLEARDRLWQMDISVRSAAGRLAEVLGPGLLETDREQRRKGLLESARRTLAVWNASPVDSALIAAYSAGANAYLRDLSPADYPLEFKLLDYAPEPWSPLKCVVFYKKMAETLCYRHFDLEATNTLHLLGRETFDFLFPERNPHDSPIIPDPAVWDFEPLLLPAPALSLTDEVYPYEPLPQSPDIVGSNNWAVSGAKTAAGYPILCGDPHLGLTLPSVWYELQIQTPDFNAYGVSFPGGPGIPIGFNEYIAWTETNVGHDVVDWYRITWADSARTRYVYEGEVMEVEIVEEKIAVRGAPDVVEKVKYTGWGPVVYEDPDSPYRDLAMHWIANELPAARARYELGAFFGLMNSRNYEDYVQALSYYDLPAQNFAFAGRDGDIAITVNGKFPLKYPEQGRFIRDGRFAANGWQGSIPRAHLPRVRNPVRGFIASANQQSTDPDYPYYYNGNFEDYRGRYINRQLEAMDSITITDLQALQMDNYSLKAEEGVPLLLALLDPTALDASGRELLGLLQDWDYRYPPDSRAAILFEEWLAGTRRAAFDELYAMRDSIPVLLPESWRLLDLLADHPAHPVFDRQETSAVERASDIVTLACRQTLAEYGEALRTDGYGWARHQGARISHLGRIGAFSVNDLEAGGSPDAPNALRGSFGPSWRMVVELGPEVRAWGVYPGGPSGNPGSSFYDNTVGAWTRGDYYELFFMNNAEDDRQPRSHRIAFRPN